MSARIEQHSFKLKTIPNFGEPLAENAATFRWPTVEDLRNLNLTMPPKLKEVWTDGVISGGMTAI